MKTLWVWLLAIMFAILATACSKNPSINTPEQPTAKVDTPITRPNSTSTPTPQIRLSPTLAPSATPQNIIIQPSATIPVTQATPSPVSSPPTATPAPTNPPCLDEAVFVGDLTVPDGTIFRPGEAFTKTWRVKNTGTCTWSAGYSLDYYSGDIMSGNLNNPIGPVAPGELVDITVDLAAPARGGEQIGYWQFHNSSGQPFGIGYNGGYPLWVKINVTFFNPNPQPTAVVIMPPPGPAPSPTRGAASRPAPTPISPSSPSPTPAAGAVIPTAPPASSGCTPQQNMAYVDQMLRLINQARAENGLQPVFLQSQLTAAALKHSIDMACNRFVDHNGSDGSTWYDRVQAEGYANPRSARENIYVGADAQGTFDWWMGSQVHHDNILFPTVTEVGIGYVFVPGSPYGSYFTLVLARR